MPPWLGWITSGFTIVGTLLTGVAFYFTFREARAAKERAAGAKQAAEAALEAANEAKEGISERVTIADLASIRSGFYSVVSLLEAQKPELAVHEVRMARQRVNELRERPGFEGNREGVDSLLTDLAQLQETIERKLWTDPTMVMPLTEISKVLASHSDRLTAWAEQMRFN